MARKMAPKSERMRRIKKNYDKLPAKKKRTLCVKLRDKVKSAGSAALKDRLKQEKAVGIKRGVKKKR